MTDEILKNRHQGHRDSTYAMLVQLVATNQVPECLAALEQMVRIGCWRDVRGFIRQFESHGCVLAHAGAVIAGCVRMTNAQIRKDRAAQHQSLAAKWVPREPKCRGAPLLKWYYDALAADMFPGVPDANRRYRKLISALSPPQTKHPVSPAPAWFVRQAERAQTDEEVQAVNALWRQHLARCAPCHHGQLIPALSLAHSMGPGHNNCLHAGIGLALQLLGPGPVQGVQQLLTFSSRAEWHALGNDFVSQVHQLLLAARRATNGLNANATAASATAASATAASATAASAGAKTLLIIGDMEHDEPTIAANGIRIVTWNVSRNGRPASFCGDKCHGAGDIV